MKSKKSILIILDGWGYLRKKAGNAIENANKPHFDRIIKENPWCLLKTHSEFVGLPPHTMGGSEVGHLNIGAGRIVYQDLTRINKAINNGSFSKNKIIKKLMDNCKKHKSVLHLIGLMSDAGVHSDYRHLKEIFKIAHAQKIKCYVHVVADGRDVEQKTALKYIKDVEKWAKAAGQNKNIFATLIGRFYAMDRNKRWERTQKTYDLFVNAKGKKSEDIFSALKDAYKKSGAEKIESDEFIEPYVIDDFKGISENDSVFMFNYRSDRVRQLVRAFANPKFDYFPTKKLKNIVLATMCNYDSELKLPVVFPEDDVVNSIGEVISKNKMQQFRIAETEKYAHVTYFFNGGREKPFKGEERKIIPSPHVRTYDEKPRMSIDEVEKTVVNSIYTGKYDFIVVNFANPDMVGHTGNYKATVKAIEATDKSLIKVFDAAAENDYNIFICADHGNAEEMTGVHKTSHTFNPVRFIVANHDGKLKLRNGVLADIAPTILELMGIKKPKEMGKGLIK